MLFRSVKNWLTLLILALVALAMLVAWVYVVPPLADRLDQQKLAETSGATPSSISDTVATSRRQVRPRRPRQATVSDRDPLLATHGDGPRPAVRRARRASITHEPGRSATTPAASDDLAGSSDYPMIGRRPSRPASSCRASVHDRRRAAYAATAVPCSQNGGRHGRRPRCSSISSLKDVDKAVAAVQRQLLLATVLALAISLILGYLASYFIARRLKRIERSAEAIAGGDLTAKVPATVEDEIGQLAGDLQRHGRAAAERLRPGGVRARPRRGAAQRPERRRARPRRRRDRDDRQSGGGRAARRRVYRSARRPGRGASRPTSPRPGASRARTATSQVVVVLHGDARWRRPPTQSAAAPTSPPSSCSAT